MGSEVKDRDPHLFATDWYEDITSQITENAQKLGPGGVALARDTKMYDALPAFQIGTAKVDTGSPQEFKTLQSELDSASSSFPLNNDINCAILFDRLLRAEIAWHEGYSLLQTVLSCTIVEQEIKTLMEIKFSGSPLDSVEKKLNEYMDKISAEGTIESLVKVYLWSVIKACGMCIEIVENHGSTAVFPEEDFHSTTYTLEFLEQFPVQRVIELLEQARKRAANLGFKLVAEKLALRVSWLTVLKQKIPKKLANVEHLMNTVEKWESNSTNDDELSKVWFTVGCQSRLNMACLRQDTVTVSLDHAKQFWMRILGAIRNFTPVYKVTRSVDLLGMFLTFSSRREPAIVRGMAKCLFTETQVLGQSAKQWALMDINETMPPPGLKLGNKALDAFIGQASLCYVDLLTFFCQNRCRMREGLSALVVSFDSLQVAADQLDQLLDAATQSTLVAADGTRVPAMHLSSWTYFRKLQVMLWQVLLSFETDVLQYSEMGWTYWYASKLCQLLLSQLGRMRLAFEQYGHNARESPGFSYLVALELESQMLLQFTTAQYMVWISLHKLKPPTTSPHVSRDFQFRLRFQAFSSVGIPEPLQLSEYDELAANLEITTALQSAGNSLQSVRQMLSALGSFSTENEEIPLLKRSAVGLSVAVATTVKLGHQPISVEIDRTGFHWYFPVPKIAKAI